PYTTLFRSHCESDGGHSSLHLRAVTRRVVKHASRESNHAATTGRPDLRMRRLRQVVDCQSHTAWRGIGWGRGANGFLWQEVSVAATFLAATRSRPTTRSATRTACAQTLLKLPDVFFTVGELWIDLQRGGQLRGRLRHVLQTGKDHRCVPAQFHVVRRGADGHAQRPRRIVVFPEQVLNPAERVEDIRL